MSKYNLESLSDEEFARLLRNAEGRNELERAMFIEAAKRINERAYTIQILQGREQDGKK